MKKIEINQGNLTLQFNKKDTFHEYKDKNDHVILVDRAESGWLLLINGRVKYTQLDCCIYNEMLAHGAMNSHYHPLDVLVVGASDGFLVRELLRHRSVRRINWIMDSQMTREMAQKHFGSAQIENHPKVHVLDEDALEHVRKTEFRYDVMVVDSDYQGNSNRLLTHDFYQALANIGKHAAVVFCQAGSCMEDSDRIQNMRTCMSSHFACVGSYSQPLMNQWGGHQTWMWGAARNLASVDESTLSQRQEVVAITSQFFNLDRFRMALNGLPEMDTQLFAIHPNEDACQTPDHVSETADSNPV